MRRWLLTIHNVSGAVTYSERFWLRRNAEAIGVMYTTPLPLIADAMERAGITGKPILTYHITNRSPR